ncbi:hypothetical protein FRB94_002176 [Tulasnella sp. JGI-2019a]|nr:hypothetical protein FRB94_002176 [Tulasnella sp. JGI-2019a]KAG8989426.1 hypothetical protein FRB93_003627 [Tulasnella sp. JGI-2019a]
MTDIGGQSEVVKPIAHHSAEFSAVIEHIVAGRLAKSVAVEVKEGKKGKKGEKGKKGKKLGGKGNETQVGWKFCTTCKQPKPGITEEIPTCKSCRHYTEVATAVITKYLADTKKWTLDASVPEQGAVHVSTGIVGTEPHLTPVMPTPFDSSVDSKAVPSHTVMGTGLGSWDGDAGSLDDRDGFFFVGSDSEGSHV